MADEYLIRALEEIRDFGFKNSGKGFSCAEMAEKALAEYAGEISSSRVLSDERIERHIPITLDEDRKRELGGMF